VAASTGGTGGIESSASSSSSSASLEAATDEVGGFGLAVGLVEPVGCSSIGDGGEADAPSRDGVKVVVESGGGDTGGASRGD
jgi:hypothetical protein